ncbi:hypothetical protein OSB04_026541 [Centaurea solstitialis]|uniref:Uncharacterized protein n=1 Tax=Centaurea solstitialis TaxID=347529 RepID=A0AA38W5Z5_9ASTR|nr:hypothetical protein OSB04_026541 [Centaurea solstitialis]
MGEHVAIPDHGSVFGSVHGCRGLVGFRMDPGYLVKFVSRRVQEMTTITVDLQIVQLINCRERIIEVERTLCGIDGVILLYVDYKYAKFTIETTRDPEEIRGALQHMFPGTSVTVSRRINTPNSSIQHPPGFHDTARDMVEGCRGKGLAIVEYTQTTTLKMNFTDQPTTSSSARNVRDPEHGGYGYGNAAPTPPPQYQASTSGSAGPYGRYPASAPPMPKTEAEGYVYGYPPSEKKTEGEGYVYGYPCGCKFKPRHKLWCRFKSRLSWSTTVVLPPARHLYRLQTDLAADGLSDMTGRDKTVCPTFGAAWDRTGIHCPTFGATWDSTETGTRWDNMGQK